jgi:parvulin-like peptidyl-prolyl isomerase
MGLKQKILEGEAFADLAAVHSECPSGKAEGGSLGMLVRGAIIPELNQAIFEDMELGEISDVVETPLGFHILELQDKELGEPLTFEQAKPSIQELLHHERKGKALSQFVAHLREKALIEDDGVADAHWEKLFDSFLDGQKGS